VEPDTRLSETPEVETVLPLSVSEMAPDPTLVLIGTLKTTSRDETAALRGLGTTAEIELMVNWTLMSDRSSSHSHRGSSDRARNKDWRIRFEVKDVRLMATLPGAIESRSTMYQGEISMRAAFSAPGLNRNSFRTFSL
jgi:hypothetical protein